MRALTLAFAAGLTLAASAQAASLLPKPDPAQLGASPLVVW
jgi:hypothetical protein